MYYFAGDRFDLLPGRAAINTCAAADHGCKRLFCFVVGDCHYCSTVNDGGGVPHRGHGMKIPRLPGTAFPGTVTRLWKSMLPSTAPSFSGFCKATLSALLIFAGYESAAAFGEETKDAPALSRRQLFSP